MEKAKRPRVVRGIVVKVATGCGSAYVTLTYLQGKLFECFMHLGKAGGCPIAEGEALLRSISTSLRYGVPVEEFVEQLQGISCPSHAWDQGKHVRSCPDAVAMVLNEFKMEPATVSEEEGESETINPLPPLDSGHDSELERVAQETERLRRERGAVD